MKKNLLIAALFSVLLIGCSTANDTTSGQGGMGDTGYGSSTTSDTSPSSSRDSTFSGDDMDPTTDADVTPTPPGTGVPDAGTDDAGGTGSGLDSSGSGGTR